MERRSEHCINGLPDSSLYPVGTVEDRGRRKQHRSHSATRTTAVINSFMPSVQADRAVSQETMWLRAIPVERATISRAAAVANLGNDALLDVIFDSLSLDDCVRRSIARVARGELSWAAGVGTVNDVAFVAAEGRC